MDHPVIDAVQLFLVLREAASQNLVALFAGLPVLGLGVFHQHGAGHGLAPESELHPAHQVGILPDQLVLFDHVLDDLRRHGFPFHFHRLKQHRRELLLQFGTEGGVQQSRGVLDRKVLYCGADFVVVFVLGDIELIHGVNGIAHIGQSCVGLVLQQNLPCVLTGGQNLVSRCCASDPGDHVFHNGGDFFDGYSAIRQFRYFHIVVLSMLKSFCTFMAVICALRRIGRKESIAFCRPLRNGDFVAAGLRAVSLTFS